MHHTPMHSTRVDKELAEIEIKAWTLIHKQGKAFKWF